MEETRPQILEGPVEIREHMIRLSSNDGGGAIGLYLSDVRRVEQVTSKTTKLVLARGEVIYVQEAADRIIRLLSPPTLVTLGPNKPTHDPTLGD